ncbi:MAG: hypothetical protein DRP37_06330 [Thermodesulfobacteriota bacterium]|nr:MAG: hypothetical protein DRP37_06330 [Thermodesulfobacteriota bacterium]
MEQRVVSGSALRKLTYPIQQRIAEERFNLLKENSWHPSLHFKRVCKLWSVRFGTHCIAAFCIYWESLYS